MSLRRIFASIAAIAAGLAIVTQLLRATTGPVHVAWFIPVFLAWCAGVALIGFGLLHPFKRGWTGALVVLGLIFTAYGSVIVYALLTR